MPGNGARSLTCRGACGALLLLVLANGPGVALAHHTGGEPGDIARTTVADALGVEPASVRIVAIEPRDFPDGSLGCPQPGAAYAQVITPGHRVLVEVDGRRFDVRVAGSAGRICRPRKQAANPGADPGARPRESGERARADLAARLDLPVASVIVEGLRRLAPGEAVTGCGTPCAVGARPADCPVGVRLRAGDRVVDYVALPTEVRACPDLAIR